MPGIMTSRHRRGTSHNFVMKKRLQSYVRPYRIRWGFTQQEIAYLTGCRTREYISRLEGPNPNPKVSIAFALQVIFGCEPDELFPVMFSEVEDAVVARAYNLHERLQGDSSKVTRIRLDFLEHIIARARQRESTHSAI